MSFKKQWAVEDNDHGSLLLGFERFRQPLGMRRSVEVFTGMYSWDPRFLKGLEALSDSLNDCPQLQPSVDEVTKMVGDNGIASDFSKIRTVAGYAMNPLSWIPVDNSKLCEDLKIPGDFRNERHRVIFDELFAIGFSSWVPSAVKVPKLSTLGIPMMWCYDASYKKEAAYFLYANIDKILALVEKRDFASLAVDYGMIWCYNNNRRGQVDSVGKERFVADLEYALSGGRRGKWFAADKKVIIDGQLYDRFSATRERIVQGASWMLNSIIQALTTGHMYSLFDRFPETFHHTDPQKIAEEAARFGDATFSDVSDYDRSMRSFLIDRMFTRMKDYWDPRLVEIAEFLYYAPYYTRPLDQDVSKDEKGRNWGFVANPFRPDLKPIHAGNRSGHAMTSFVAKMMKVFDSLCVIDDITNDVVGNVERYLSHKMGIALVNNGDDEGAFGSPLLIAKYREYRYDGLHGYFSVSPEVGQVFSGSMIRWKGDVKAIPRLSSTFEKMYCPERSIGGKFRSRWPIGFLARLKAITEHPMGSYAQEIHLKVWRDYWQPHFGSFTDVLAQAFESIDVAFDHNTNIDNEVLEDNDKLLWKYKDSDVSEHVLKKIVVNILPEELEWCYKFYSGLIM